MKLPTAEELSRMSPQALLQLWQLVQTYKRKLAEAEGCGLMPQSAVKAMTDVVDDRLMQDIVNDNRKGLSQPGWLPPEKPGEVAKGSGWLKPQPLDGSVPGLSHIDRIAESFAARDRVEEIAGLADKLRKLKGAQ